MSDEQRSSISKAKSYAEIGEYWDEHDVTEHWEATEPVSFDVDIQADVRYFVLESSLANQVTALAQQRGVSAESLVNLWIQDKLAEASDIKTTAV